MTTRWMARAIELAKQGHGDVEPNPMVGAVLVKEGAVVGEGYHHFFGGPHAEVDALTNAAGEAEGATIYVTLEPCSTSGKTGACVEALKRARVARVVMALADPFEAHQSKGVDLLRSAGIEVEVGDGEAEARPLLNQFLSFLRSRRPFVVAKWAMTLDGKMASKTGHSQWITSPPSRDRGHYGRGLADAVMVGVGTVVHDNPQLTCRLESPPRGKQPIRVVFDPRGSLPLESEFVRQAENHDTWVLGKIAQGMPPYVRALGCSTLVEGLELLRSNGVNRLFVEGGPGVLTALFEAECVDRVQAFVAPKLVGGRDAKTPYDGLGLESMNEAISLEALRFTSVGDDVLIEGDVRRTT